MEGNLKELVLGTDYGTAMTSIEAIQHKRDEPGRFCILADALPYCWHATLVVVVLNKLHKHFLTFQIQKLFVEVALRSRLSKVSELICRPKMNQPTWTIPNVPSALWHSATNRLGVEGLPQVMATLDSSSAMGKMSLGSK